MSRPLDGLRIGSVPYLNARPLIEGLGTGVRLAVPAQLAAEFAVGELDVALVPLFEAVKRDRAALADDIAIACRGEVFSVFVAHREPLAEVESIALDPASNTSNHLLQCLLAEFHDLAPRYETTPAESDGARLLIGDAALAFRREHAADGWQYLDLGAEWQRCTGLPFVFACWVLRDDLPKASAVAEGLRGIKRAGLAARDRIAAAEPDAAFARRYLHDFIRFDLGADEKRAIACFASLLRKHGLVPSSRDVAIDYV